MEPDRTAIPSQRRALVLEQDPRTAGLVSEALRSRGYAVDHCGTGAEVWAGYREEPCDILVSSLRLPDADVTDLIAKIRRSDPDRSTYVILTGLASAEALEQGLEADADDFLDAPIDRAALQARLAVAQRVMGMQRSLQATNRRLSTANEAFRRQLEAAARVQRSLLPPENLTIPATAVGWSLRSCDELGGDILNCIRVDEHHLAFYVLDVSGHGVSSALLSVQISRLMSPLLSESGVIKERLSGPPWYRVVEPERVVGRLNELFQMNSRVPQYFTMIYGLMHLESGNTRIAAAGQSGPIYIPRGDTPRTLPVSGRPVGFFEDSRYQQHELVLREGDRLWLYSDGATEAEDEHETMLGLDGLRDRIVAAGERPVQDAVDSVMSALEDWTHPASPRDDCSLLALERTG